MATNNNEYYWRRAMGNGAVAAKFRISPLPPITPKSVDEKDEENSVERPDSHHPNSCERCYRLKKKCLRSKPKCLNCTRMGVICHYAVRGIKRKRTQPQSTQPQSSLSLSSVENGDGLDVEFRFVDPEPVVRTLAPVRSLKLSVSLLISPDVRHSSQVSSQIKLKVMNPSANSVQEEFANLAPVEDVDLPLVWLMNYWENFGSTYPFVDYDNVRKSLGDIDFATELIIPFEVYLMMAIGAITYDARTQGKLTFNGHFSKETIETMIEVLDLDDTKEGTFRVLLLLAIYAVVLLNEHLLWNLVGILCRSALKHDLYRPILPMYDRIWWSIYNLDCQLLVLLAHPPGLVDRRFIQQRPLREKMWPGEDLERINQEISRHRLLADLLVPMLVPGTEVNPSELSQRLERWRQFTTACIHRQATNVEDATAMVNVDYYYMCTEIDQLSLLELLQFPLHFLLNLFRLALRDDELDKHQVKQLLLMFWYRKFFKVIDYFLLLLTRLAASNINRVDLSVKLTEYVLNLQVMTNLLKYLQENEDEMAPKLTKIVEKLTTINAKILTINVMTPEGLAALRQFNDNE